MSSWGLYKPGQGYWVRVMTAAAIALLTFATAGWMMGQMAVLSEKLPKSSWTGQVTLPAKALVQVGDRVALLSSARDNGKPDTLGTATVKRFDPSTSSIRLGSFEPAVDGAVAADAAAIAPATGVDAVVSGAAFVAPIRGSLIGEPPISSILLQGIAAAVCIIGGAILAWYFCGVRKGSSEFLISTDMEMKKVAWSTRKDILTSTWVVVGASFLIAAVLFGIDLVFQALFRGIDVLQ